MTRIIVRLGIFLCLVLSAAGLALKAGARESSSYLLAFYALPVALSSGPVYVVVRDRDINLVLSRDAYTYGELAWSPDGTRLAFNANECSGVCIYDFNSGQRLSFDDLGIEINGSSLAWANDGRFAFLTSHHFDRPPDIVIADASGVLETFTPSVPPLDVLLMWSPNGRYLMYTGVGDDGGLDFFIMNTSSGTVTNTTGDVSNVQFPLWSPQGELLYTVFSYTATPYIAAYNPTAGGGRRVFESDRISIDYPAVLADGELHILAWRETNTGLELRNRTANRVINLILNFEVVADAPEWRADGQEVGVTVFNNQERETYIISTTTGAVYAVEYRNMQIINPTWSP